MNMDTFNYLFEKYKPIQHRLELHWLVDEVETINPEIILEIGVNTGATLGFWDYLLNKDTDLLIGIDIRNNMKWDTRISKNKIKFLISDSTDNKTIDIVANILQNRKIDFLFIDGNHSLRYVTSDYENYSKFVRKGGIIAFHDIYNEKHPGVKQFWDKLKGIKESCIYNPGTGLIRK